jgi:hypothetical protein
LISKGSDSQKKRPRALSDAGRLEDSRFRVYLLFMGILSQILGPKAPLKVAFNATAGGPPSSAEIKGYEALRNWKIPEAVRHFQEAITQGPERSIRIAHVCYQAGNLDMVLFVLKRGFYRQNMPDSAQPNVIGQVRIICALLFFQATGCLPPQDSLSSIDDLLAWNTFVSPKNERPATAFLYHSCMLLNRALSQDEESAIVQAACMVAIRNSFEIWSLGDWARNGLRQGLIPALKAWKSKPHKDPRLRQAVDKILNAATAQETDVDRFQVASTANSYNRGLLSFSKNSLQKLYNSEIPIP